jgi:hypothetical protein
LKQLFHISGCKKTGLFILFRAIFVMSGQLRGFLKKLIRCRTTFNFVVLAAFAFVGAGQVFGSASVTTDQSDYPPGSTATINGSGFQPGETVELQVLRTDLPENSGPEHVPWLVTNGASGNFTTTWYVTLDEAGATLQLTATGLTSGLVAQMTFTDGSGAGTMTVSPTLATAGSTGNTLTFQFRTITSSGAYGSGSYATVVVPTGWTAPQKSSGSSPGFISVSAVGSGSTASVSLISGSTITINFTCNTGTGNGFNLTYGGGGTAVTADTVAGTDTFTTATHSGSGGTPTALSTSPTVTVNAAAASKLVITSTAVTVVAGVASTAITVQRQDANGNANTADASRTVTLASSSTGTKTFTPASLSIALGSSSATFTYTDTKAGTPTITAASTSPNTITSATQVETVTAAAASKLVITSTAVTVTAGVASTAITVQRQDANGNANTADASRTVTLASSSTGTKTFTPASLSIALGSSSATFTYTDTKAGTPTITAASTSPNTITSATQVETVTAAAASQLVFTTQPSASTVAGVVFATQPVVKIEDAFGNVVTTGADSTVSVALTKTTGTGSLTGTASMNAVAGVADFAGKGLKIDLVGADKVLTATATVAAGTKTATTSPAFTITPAAASQLVFTTSAVTVTAGVASGNITVQRQDQYGNPVTAEGPRTVTLASDSTGTVTFNPTSLTISSSSASFTYMDTKAGTPTITAASTSPNTITSATQVETVTAAAASKLVITSTAVTVTAGVASTAITVQRQDANGNANTADATRTVTLASDSTGTVTFNPTSLTIASGSSSATFTYTDTKAGTPTITAASTVPNTITSATQVETVNAATASKLAYTTVPGTGTAGTAFSVTVQSQDANGNPANLASATTITLSKATGGGTLSGTLTGSIGSGTNSVTIATPVYSMSDTMMLTATASGGDTLTAVTSGAIVFSAGAATATTVETAADGSGSVIGVQNITAGNSITVYAITRDANGNFVANPSATWSLPTMTGGVVSGDLAGGTGSAVFTGHLVGTAIIRAVASTFTGNSGTQTVIAGTAAKLAFTTQPGGGTGGTAWATAARPVVTVQDAGGNTVTTDTSTVTVAILFNAGPDGILSGTLTRAAVAGVATFSGLKIDKIGTGYTLTATDGSLTSATSSAFNITTGAATKLAYTTVPSTGTAGTAFSVTVQSQDAGGNPASLASDTTITLSNPTGGGILSGTLTGSIGIGANSVTFSTLVYSKSDTMKLKATASGGVTLTAVTSGNIVFSAGAATQLAFTTQPGGGTGGTAWATKPVVTVQDANGNTVTTDTSTVTVAIQNNAGPGGVLSGTLTKAAVVGVASFSANALKIDKIGTGYTLTATDGSLTSATSSPFDITTGTAKKLVYTTVPSTGTAGTAFSVTVQSQDLGGNPANLTNDTTITLSKATGGGTLSGTLTGSIGIGANSVTIATPVYSKSDTMTLTATASGGVTLTAVTSGNIVFSVGAATQLAFTTVPATGTAGTAFSVTVQSQDLGGNPANLASDTTITLSKATGGGTLSGTLTGTILTSTNSVTISTPVYSMSDTMTLTATASGGVTLTAVTSGNIVFSAGAAAKLAFTTQPGGGTGGTAWATQPVVTVQDANGNTVTTDTSTVTVAILNNAGPGGVLSGTLTKAAVTGVADFSAKALKIDKIGTGYTLTATDGSLTSATSSAFDITAGTATKLAYTTVPSTGTAGTAFSVTVQSQDLGGNPANLASDTTITLSKAATGAGTLSGTLTGTILTSANSVTIATPVYSKSDTMKLTATASGGDTLTAVTSGNIVFAAGAAAKLVFTTQPMGGTGGAGLPEQSVVTVQDQFGNTVKTDTSTVTMAILFNAGTNGILSGTLTKAAVAGVASFSGNGLTIDKIGTGYTLVATDGSLTSATSSPFNITTGPATKLAYTTVPAIGTAGTAFSVTVQSQDLGGNPASLASDTTITLSNPTGGGTLSGTLTGTILTSANSVTISTPVYSMSDTMTLTATASGGVTLTAVTSGNIVFSAGALDHFAVTTPGTQTAGTAFAIATITAQDANNNTVTSFVTAVDLTETGSGAGGTVSPATPSAFTAGVLSGQSVTLSKSGAAVTITATGSAKTGVSGTFLVNPGPMAMPMTVTRTAGLTLKIAWSDVATNWSESVGGTVTLSGLNLVTTNQVHLTTNSTWILYTNSPNVNDQITYTINDSLGRTNPGVINVVINPFVTGQNTTVSVSNGTATVTFYGKPGLTYVTQRSTNLVNWVSIATNTVSSSGVINVTDNFSDLGGNIPISAYYQLGWSP